MIKVFEAKEYGPIIQRQREADEIRLHRSFDFFKEITIKLLTSLLLLNGGAIVASLTFLGTLINHPNFMNLNKFTEPLLCFACGSAITVVLCAITYLSQGYYTAAIGSSVNIHDIDQYKILNQQKIDFYKIQRANIGEAENDTLNEILSSLYKEDNEYDEKIRAIEKERDCEMCKGNTLRFFAIGLFLICLGLFLRGVYLMGILFDNL